jgi:mannose-6-phosphate isomerase-like protein (cupin superfamily)
MDRTKVQALPIWPLVSLDNFAEQLLTHPYCFDQRQVYAVLTDQSTVMLHSPEDYRAMKELMPLTIKIEGMERMRPNVAQACRSLAKLFNHDGPVTCHLYVADAGAASFPLHVDPDDVFLQVVSGRKDMLLEGDDPHVERFLDRDNPLFIPRGTAHQALNLHASVMLSYGLESWGVDKMKN